jgi:PAS domain-containing protein
MKQPLNSSDYNHYSLFDNMLEGVQVLDFDYRYVYLNEVVVNQAKSSHSDLINQKITAKFPGIDQ